jgi:hypothetical protein
VITITYNPECFKLNFKNARGWSVVIVMPMLNICVFDVVCRLEVAKLRVVQARQGRVRFRDLCKSFGRLDLLSL